MTMTYCSLLQELYRTRWDLLVTDFRCRVPLFVLLGWRHNVAERAWRG